MGNKQSGAGSQHHFGEPTSRSFSWQPDPLFAGPPVKRGESFTASGGPSALHCNAATNRRSMPYAASEYGSAGVYKHRQASSPNFVSSNGNGSVVRGDAAFGGVQKESLKPSLKSSASSAGKLGTLVNTADSGYMTEINAHDSENSARTRLRGSRLSLNDALLGGTEFVQQPPPPPPMMHPGTLPMGHHYVPIGPPHAMIPFGQPPPGFFPPPDPFLFAPVLSPRGALMDEKKAKKLRKKQQKNQQQLSRQSSMIGDGQTPGEFIPPGAYSLLPAPVIAYPPPGQLANFRSRSIDNFMAAGLIQPPPMAPAPAQHIHPVPAAFPGAVRRYNSHVDVSSMGINYQTATLGPGMGLGTTGPSTADYQEKPAPAKKERKYEKRKDQQPGSLRDSSVSSSRGRLADATSGVGKSTTASKSRAEASVSAETRKQAESNNETAIENALGNGPQERHILNVSSENVKNRMPQQRSEVIYETLKGAQRAMLATRAEINSIAVNSTDKNDSENRAGRATGPVIDNKSQDSPPPPTPKPVVITPEAKAILERNARILVEAEREERQQAGDPSTKKEVGTGQKAESRQVVGVSGMVDHLPKIPTPPPPPPLPPVQSQRQEKEIIAEPVFENKMSTQKDSIKEELVAEIKSRHVPDVQTPMHQSEKITRPISRAADEEQLVQETRPSEKVRPSAYDHEDIEPIIEAILNPVLPRKKYKKPKDFEPLDAWRGINVQQELIKRQPQRTADLNRDQQMVVEERIQVRLVPAPPSRREQHGSEPIYLEYDERLPEFKKRLIETGSFDIPEVDKFHHRSNSQLSGGSRGRIDASPTKWDANASNRLANGLADPRSQSQPQLWRDYVAMEEATAGNGSIRSRKTIDSNKGSLRKLKESMASIFRTKSTDQLKAGYGGQPATTAADEMPATFAQPPAGGGRYAPSLTPSTSKIKAGDSSDIDFSWVHDLETRFRLEREQFERELQTLKQKSATLQKNDYMLSPKLQRQNSYQPGISADVESTRDEHRLSPSLRIAAAAANEHRHRYQHNQYREKNLSSSMDLAASPPAAGRMSVYHSQQALNEGGFPSARPMLDQQSKQRYFGIYDTAPSAGVPPDQHNLEMLYRGDPYDRSFRKELQQLAPANVRQKAALFENESQRVQREMEERNQHLSKQRQQHRSSSAPHRNYVQQPYRLQQQRSLEADEPIYIPRPDYDENTSSAHQQNRPAAVNQPHLERSNGVDFHMPSTNSSVSGRYKNGMIGDDDRLFAPPYTDEPLVVNTAAGVVSNQRPGYVSSPRSPSERRLARFYHSNAGFASPNNPNGNRGNSGPLAGRYESQPILTSTRSGSPHAGRYSPGSRSPRLLRAKQQTMLDQYFEANRNNANWSRNVTNNGYVGNGQQMMMKGQRPVGSGVRGVAFANE